MPEGHTIHRLALDHTRGLAGQRVRVSSPQGRNVDIALVLDGRVMEQVEAYGKHLFYRWRDAPILHIHLGLIGSFGEWTPPPPPPGPNVQLRMMSSRVAVDLRGATTRELIDGERQRQILDRLGPDVLARDADPERAWERLSRRSIPIGAALLDQQMLSGVGNVYRAEALFVSAIHPERPADSLSRTEFDRLWSTLVAMLRQGVEERRISTVHTSERAASDEEGAFYVYQQQYCRRCGGAIRAWSLGPRRAYACEHCQPLPTPSPSRRGSNVP